MCVWGEWGRGGGGAEGLCVTPAAGGPQTGGGGTGVGWGGGGMEGCVSERPAAGVRGLRGWG
jgi:hypothetical protein